MKAFGAVTALLLPFVVFEMPAALVCVGAEYLVLFVMCALSLSRGQ